METMAVFLKDLQILAFLESDEIESTTETVEMAALLKIAVDENIDGAQLRQQQLRLEIEGALPPFKGIPTLLKEAAANLITNAIKYTPYGGVITVRAHAHPDEGALKVSVEDNGVGISPVDQGLLFHDFGRPGPNRHISTNVMKSTGLGLSIVRRIAELHHGNIAVESELDKGSKFTITLPI
jgi:signal transduction histidine kinase